MQMTSALRHLATLGCASLLLSLIGHAQALGMAVPISAPPAAAAPDKLPGPYKLPTLNHATLVLKDGRVLVAGGMAASSVNPDREIGTDSEIWDPRTGEWQKLGNALRFDPDQLVYLNQIDDGRVLLFAARAKSEAPEYQARFWNPQNGTVEKVEVRAQPKADTDVAVLDDGRVLIINGVEGSADTWDSRTGKVTHSEVPQLENSRWRALPLKNKTVLVVEAFADDEAAARKRATQSAALLWNTASDEWKATGDLPVIFGRDGALAEMDVGAVQAEVAGRVYRLAAAATVWEGAPPAIQPPAAQSAVAASPAGAASSPAAAGAESPSWWDEYGTRVSDDMRWAFPFVPLLLFMLLVVRLKGDSLPYSVLSVLITIQRSVAVIFALVVGWILLRNGPAQTLEPVLGIWWSLYQGHAILFCFAACLAMLIVTPFLSRVVAPRMEEERRYTLLKRVSRAALVARISLLLLFLAFVTQAMYDWYADTYGPMTLDSWQGLPDAALWVLLAIAAPLVLYVFVSRLRQDRQAHLVRYAGFLFGTVGIVFCALLVLAATGSYVPGGLPHYAEACAASEGWRPLTPASLRNWARCVGGYGGIIGSVQFRPTRVMVMSLPSAPCRYVGTWSSTRPGSKYKITLTDDSRFVGEPVGGTGGTVRGLWGAVDGKMIWFYDTGVAWPPDINQILPESRSRFTLVEVNGTRTQFELIDAIKSNSCLP